MRRFSGMLTQLSSSIYHLGLDPPGGLQRRIPERNEEVNARTIGCKAPKTQCWKPLLKWMPKFEAPHTKNTNPKQQLTDKEALFACRLAQRLARPMSRAHGGAVAHELLLAGAAAHGAVGQEQRHPGPGLHDLHGLGEPGCASGRFCCCLFLNPSLQLGCLE